MTNPITTNHALTIRAGEGHRPVLRQSEETVYEQPLFVARGALILEGLVVEAIGRRADTGDWKSIVWQTNSGSLHAANCRFLKLTNGPCVTVHGGGLHEAAQLRAGNAAKEPHDPILDSLLGVHIRRRKLLSDSDDHHCQQPADIRAATLRLRRNTVLGNACVYMPILALPERAEADTSGPSVSVEASQNVFYPAKDWSVFLANYGGESPPQAADLAALLPRLTNWRGERNLFPAERRLLEASVGFDRSHAESVTDLAAWSRFWGSSDSDSLQGPIHLQGGAILSGSYDSPEAIRSRRISASARTVPATARGGGQRPLAPT